jgi:segregation and condensation protein A
MAAMPEYKVQLDSYSGPMDLLLYLIRRDEVDIYDIPISGVLEQYIGYVRVLEQLDPDAVGDFLVLAATLMEIKSRMLLPKPPPEVEDDDGLDPRADLVRQLLAYKAFRDAAGDLGRRADEHASRHPRPGVDLPEDTGHVDIEDVQIWDLLGAFNKLLAAVGRQRTQHEVIYDDTPVTLHAADILDRLEREGPAMLFERIFEGRSRGEMVGLFLALLELIRQDRVRVEQRGQFGPIHVHLIDPTPITTVMEAGEHGFKEALDAEAEEDVETMAEELHGEEAEPVFLELPPDADDDEEEEDEFTRRISAVKIEEVDLGRAIVETAGPEGDSVEDSPEAASPPRPGAVGAASPPRFPAGPEGDAMEGEVADER